MAEGNALLQIVRKQGFLTLDGGLGSSLELREHKLSTDLWSAALVRSAPGGIVAVHTAFLEAGADVIIASSYQATVEGFQKEFKCSAEEGEALLRKSVALAVKARDDFWAAYTKARAETEGGSGAKRHRPLVAASVGCYGAFLAGGQEFTADYGSEERRSRAWLATWHWPRLQILAQCKGIDLIALETIPCREEALALLELLKRLPGSVPAYLSLACRDGRRLNSGEDFQETIEEVLRLRPSNLIGLGVNCTDPAFAPALLRTAREALRGTDLILLCYPNSGQQWDGEARCWVEREEDRDEEKLMARWSSQVREWYTAGARAIGGCCRTDARHIAATWATVLQLVSEEPSATSTTGTGSAGIGDVY